MEYITVKLVLCKRAVGVRRFLMRFLTVGSSLQGLMILFNYACMSLFSELPEQGINVLPPCIGCCAWEMAEFRVRGQLQTNIFSSAV